MTTKKKTRNRRAPARAPLAHAPVKAPPPVVGGPSGVYVKVPVSSDVLDAIAEGRELAAKFGALFERAAEIVARARRRE